MSKAPMYVLWGATLAVGAAFAIPKLLPSVTAPGPVAAPAAHGTSATSAEEELRLASEPIRPLPLVVALDGRKVALGRRLFHDKRLSKDHTISCASCHSLDLGGVDRKARSEGVGGAVGSRNSPTVLNSGFNFKQFWDGRADSLEEQVDGPLLHPSEMASSWDETIASLRADTRYQGEFTAAYADGVTPKNVRDAIATFERSLVTPNSRFDRYLRGEKSVLTAAELRGYARFKEVGCTTCHQGVNVGGTMFQTLGAMEDYAGTGKGTEKRDQGRFNVTGREADRNRFKVPTLRNVALTPPYLHDGTFETLDGAVQLMAKHQLGVEMPAGDVEDIVRFLNALTGTYEAR